MSTCRPPEDDRNYTYHTNTIGCLVQITRCTRIWDPPWQGAVLLGGRRAFCHVFRTCIKPNCSPDDPPPDPPTPPCGPWTIGPCDKPSPLILDLDGDGVEADALTYFDHSGDGWAELSRWANEDDGTLVWDRNNDGIINDGSELFGDNTDLDNGNKVEHGFAALADLDSNGDGVIDSSDAAWTELRVMRWTDDNNNGIKDEGEESLVTLDSLGIESLNTGFTNSNHVDTVGNEHRQEGSYTKTDGTTATMTDVWFVTSTGITQYDDSDIPTHSTTIGALPDTKGGGRVYDLRDAMALDDATDADGNSRLTAPYYSNSRTETRSLREMVEDFAETNTDGTPKLNKTAREALAVKIIYC